jgi:hypothetical protein
MRLDVRGARIQRVLDVIQRQPRWLVMAFCLASLTAVGLMDYLVPADAVATVFYLLPLSLGTWCLSRSAGLGLAIGAAATYMACEGAARGALGGSILFNTAVEGAVFVIVVLLLNGLKTHLEGEQDARLAAEQTLAKVRQLSALLPMCSSCKKIRHEPDGSWQPFEVYLLMHSDTQVSHGMCPDCMAKAYPEQFGRLQEKKAQQHE